MTGPAEIRATIRQAQLLLDQALADLGALQLAITNRPAEVTYATQPDAIPLGPRSQPGDCVVGYSWLEALMGFNIQPPGSFPEEYKWIGQQSDEDRAKVAAALQSDVWVATHRGLVTPRHLVRNWGRYLNPPAKYVPPKDFKTQREDDKAETLRTRLAAFDAETQEAARFDRSAQGLHDFLQARMEARLRLERSLS